MKIWQTYYYQMIRKGIFSMKQVLYTDAAYESIEKACAACDYSPEWYPDRKDVEEFIMPEPERFIPFMTWLVGLDTVTAEQKETKKLIYQILYDTVEIVD